MEPHIASIQVEQEVANTNTSHEEDNKCPVHEIDLTEGFCEFCQVCYTCK